MLNGHLEFTPFVEAIEDHLGRASEEQTKSKSQPEDFTPSNTPTPTGLAVEVDGEIVEVTLKWNYVQGTIPADQFLIFQSRGTPLTLSDSAVPVSIASRIHRVLVARGKTYRFGIAAANGSHIGSVIQPTSSPDWEISIGRDATAL